MLHRDIHRTCREFFGIKSGEEDSSVVDAGDVSEDNDEGDEDQSSKKDNDQLLHKLFAMFLVGMLTIQLFRAKKTLRRWWLWKVHPSHLQTQISLWRSNMLCRLRNSQRMQCYKCNRMHLKLLKTFLPRILLIQLMKSKRIMVMEICLRSWS